MPPVPENNTRKYSKPPPSTSRARGEPRPVNRAALIRSTSSPRRRLSTSPRLKIFGSTPARDGLAAMIASIALSSSSPMTALFAWAARLSQRAAGGTRKTPSSDTYLRKTRPSTKSLYCAASIVPRSLSAARQSTACSSAVPWPPGGAGWPFLFRPGMPASAGGGVEQGVVPLALAQHQPAAVQQVGLGQRAVLRHHLAVDGRGALAERAPRVAQRRGERRRAECRRKRRAWHERRRRDLGREEGERPLRGAGRRAAEQDPARLLGRRGRLGAVHQRGGLPGEAALAVALVRRLGVRLGDRRALLDGQQRELGQEPLDVRVRAGHPVLEELVRGGTVGRQPDRALLGLAELLAVGPQQQRPGERVHVPAV